MNQILDITSKELVIDYRAREWCKLPYPDHPHGCPNYGHKATCPPGVCQIESFLDLSLPMLLVLEPFDLTAHTVRMRALHPHWSDRQARCVRYWQSGVNKRLEATCAYAAVTLGWNVVWTICPEAMGINVIKTVKRLGVQITTHPINQIIKVGLVGYGRG